MPYYISILLCMMMLYSGLAHDVTDPFATNEESEEIILPEEKDSGPIHAAYPIDSPPQTNGITEIVTTPLKTPAPNSPFISPEDEIFNLSLTLGEQALSFPAEQVKSVVYNKSTKCVVAEATAYGHHLLREWLSPFEADTQVKMTAKVYEVTPTHAWQAVRKPWAFSSVGMKPLHEIDNTTDERTQAEKIREHDDGTFTSVKWEPYNYDDGFTTRSLFDLRFQRSLDSPKISLQVCSRFNSEHPTVYALGQSSENPETILLATVHIYPISANGEMLLDGRICNNFSDHEEIRIRSIVSHLGARLENGASVYRMTIPKDYFPIDDYIPSDPFAEDVHVPTLMPKLTSNPLGINPDSRDLCDPTEYFTTRGMPVPREQDWMAYDSQTETLFYHLPELSREILEVLSNNSTNCFFPQPTHDVAFIRSTNLSDIKFDETTPPDGLYSLYSVPEVPGMPWRVMSTPSDSEKHPSFVMVDSISHFNNSWSVTTELEIEQHTAPEFKSHMKFTAAERKPVLSERRSGTEDEDTTTVLYLNHITEKGHLESEE